MTQPISYTEFHRRLEAANAEMRGQKVVLKKDGSGPTDQEFAKWHLVLNKHGIDEFDLRWDAATRSFQLVPWEKAEVLKHQVEIVISNPPPEPSLIRRLLAELAERKGPPDEPA